MNTWPAIRPLWIAVEKRARRYFSEQFSDHLTYLEDESQYCFGLYLFHNEPQRQLTDHFMYLIDEFAFRCEETIIATHTPFIRAFWLVIRELAMKGYAMIIIFKLYFDEIY